MHIVYSIAARFTFFFFFFKETASYAVVKTYLHPLKKSTFYHSDVWSDLTAPTVKNTWIKSITFTAKGPSIDLSILVPL